MTDATEAGPVSLAGEAYYQDPWGFFARLRESRPVAEVRMPGYGRAWELRWRSVSLMNGLESLPVRLS